MRNYLQSAFEYFEYEKEDSEYFLGIYDKITAEPKNAERWLNAVALYEKDFYYEFGKIIDVADELAGELDIHEYTTGLLMSLCLTKHLKKLYRERGLSEEIYKNSLLDLKYKLEECKLVKGIKGTFVVYWFGGWFNLTRFALGRLQFEPVKLSVLQFDKTYEKDGITLAPDSTVLLTHIPRSGEPMPPEACDRSFELAKEFFKDTVGKSPVFACESWLLYPENETILPKHSNSYRFMKRFEIISHKTYRDNDDLWRLFDTDEKNPDRLPANGSLRRAYVEHLKKGGRTREGLGIFLG